MTDASPPEPKGWYPGMKSPNPAGRPAGRTPMALLQKRMLEEGPAVLDAVLEKAKEGDPACAGLVLSRIIPVLKAQGEKVQFDLDPTLPLAAQVEQVLAAIAGGQIAPDVGRQIIEAISALGNIRAIEELEARIITLEGKAA